MPGEELTNEGTQNGSSITFVYSEEAYYQDCLDRRSMSCSSFSYDNGGFSATFTGDRERLVFFSVPYEGGWSATVNGEPAVIEKVNVGFMAVLVPAGTSEIRFTYQTPGLALGAAVTLAGVLILLLYLWLARRFDRAAAAAQEPESAPENSFPAGPSGAFEEASPDAAFLAGRTEAPAAGNESLPEHGPAAPDSSGSENGSAAPAGGESRE